MTGKFNSNKLQHLNLTLETGTFFKFHFNRNKNRRQTTLVITNGSRNKKLFAKSLLLYDHGFDSRTCESTGTTRSRTSLQADRSSCTGRSGYPRRASCSDLTGLPRTSGSAGRTAGSRRSTSSNATCKTWTQD